MYAKELLFETLTNSCPYIHQTRLESVLDVSQALEASQNLSLSAMGRKLTGKSAIKHKIKKVDRLEGNKHLHEELNQLYVGLSQYVFRYISQDKSIPLVVDLCFVKDDRALQMLSAEVATKGRTIPLYREVFKEGELQHRAGIFLKHLSQCIPPGRQVVLIMDAGFYEDWYKAIEAQGWHWVCRVRKGKSLKFAGQTPWLSIKDFMPTVKMKTTNYNDVLLTKRHKHACRIVTTRKACKGRKAKTARAVKRSKVGSGSYSRAAKEPWILATNLPAEYKAASIVKMYSKRMQIEESFRDVKSHQFGLSGRYVRTTCTHRWGVKMLLAAIVQMTYWVIGVIGHSQGMQRIFQANTVRDKKVFSYFTLGRLIIEHNKLDQFKLDHRKLAQIIQQELDRKW